MARFSRLEVLDSMIDIGLVPVFYNKDPEAARKIVSACAAGGARVVEFTNRGDLAYRVFCELVGYFEQTEPNVILGVGSVIDPGTAALYISSGANFVVGPILNPEVAKVCNRRKVAYSPGCGSASEVSEAEELGVEICKVFPGGTVGGPAFVKALLGPCPWSRIMPTGGVAPTEESINAWFQAGVACVGMGSKLITKEAVAAKDYERITANVKRALALVRQARGQALFCGVDHPGLYPTDKATAEQIASWYAKVFGFSVHEGRSSFMVGPDGGAGRIEVVKERVTDRAHVAIRVSDFEAAVETLKERGIELGEPKVKAGTKAAFLKQPDPAGNLVHILWTL
jgi:2-dehydro-3-deoxyphosphogluconate aldolase/(4S)-4-hydroxy-2-oxoglutarate aldolase